MGRFAIAAFVLAVPALAQASNTRHERTPVLWPEPPCMTLVDRGEGTMHLDYEIPFEDTMVTADEVADSRTHQFFAMCRDSGPPKREPLPNWITQADVDAATAVGIDIGMPTAADILTTNQDWATCFVRIVADDARRPITFAAAMEGVDWDIASTPAGVFVVQGYTYEPAKNKWWKRPGVVKLHDGDPDAVGPAAAIDAAGDFSIYRDEDAMLGGCVNALEGTTFIVEYRNVEDAEWNEYSSDNPISGDAFELHFVPPPGLAGQITLLRAVFRDPMDRIWIAYLDAEIVVIDAPDPEGCGGGFVGSMCGSSSGGDTGDGSSSGTTETTGVATTGVGESGTGGSSSTTSMQTPDEPGCGCSTRARPSGVLALFVVLARRRRRAAHAID